MLVYEKGMRDYLNRRLCKPCWNNRHWHFEIVTVNGRSRKTNNKIVDCERGDCECPCVELLNEKHSKPKPDYSQQTVIDTGDDVIQIGKEKYRDDN